MKILGCVSQLKVRRVLAKYRVLEDPVPYLFILAEVEEPVEGEHWPEIGPIVQPAEGPGFGRARRFQLRSLHLGFGYWKR